MKNVIALIIAILLMLVFPLIIWVLWPLVMVPIFNLPVITYWQSMALMIICRLLFKDSSSNSKE